MTNVSYTRDQLKKKSKFITATTGKTQEKPLVSIVTVVYNAEKYLEETIKSVVNQSYECIEYILIDGGSTDNTLQIIKKYEAHISYCLSETDEGVYDAMNKGIALSSGVIIGLLNAGDTYIENTITRVVDTYLKFCEPIIVTGDCKTMLSTDGNWIIETGEANKLRCRMIPHSSVFVSSEIYQIEKLFDVSFKIAADYDFLCYCHTRKIPFVYIKELLSIASPRGVSSNYYASELEFSKVRFHYKMDTTLSLILLSLRSLASITTRYSLSILGLWPLIKGWRYKNRNDIEVLQKDD
jgi:glycosyltransferase involved in cell wall biosynthesis